LLDPAKLPLIEDFIVFFGEPPFITAVDGRNFAFLGCGDIYFLGYDD